MMKKIFILLIIIINYDVFAQSFKDESKAIHNSISAKVEDQIFKIELFKPGFVYEKGLDDKTTIYTSIYANYGVLVNNGTDSYLFPSLYPNLDLQYRRYFNLEKRKAKNKNFTNNSGQYIGAKLFVASNVVSTDLVQNYKRAQFGGVWGFQKNGKPLAFNFELGLGYGYQKNIFEHFEPENYSSFGFAGMAKFTIGILVGKHNKKYYDFM